MTLSELRQKLQLLEYQRIHLDNEIIQTKRDLKSSIFCSFEKGDNFSISLFA